MPLPDLDSRRARVRAVSDTYDSQKAFSAAIGMSESRVSKALSKKTSSERKLAPLESAITHRGLWSRVGDDGEAVRDDLDAFVRRALDRRGGQDPAAPAPVVFFVVEGPDGEPLWGYTVDGRVVQMGDPIRGTLRPTERAAADGGASSAGSAAARGG